MNQLRCLFTFLVPGSILISGALFLLTGSYLQHVTQFQVNFGSILLVILCALLAWRFDRSRVIYALQILLYTDIAIHSIESLHDTKTNFIVIAIALINFIFIAILKERGIYSLRGISILILPIIQAAAIFYWLKTLQSAIVPQLEITYLELPSPLTAIPELILLLVGITLLLQSIRFLRYPNPLEGVLFWVIVGVTVTLFFKANIQTTIISAASVLALLISLIEIAYAFAYRDELTGVPGRRALMETFKKLGSRYSIAMVDIDFFKKFNDKYGHDVGDEVLKMVATRLAKCSGGGRAYRYGGEEFCVVFPGRNVEDCLEHLEELRTRIGDQPFTIRRIARPVKKPKKPVKNKSKQHSVRVTVSIGVAEKTSLYNQPEVVMKRADQALYRAKEAGRNKVCS